MGFSDSLKKDKNYFKEIENKVLKGTDGIKSFEQTIDGLSDVITAKPAKQGNNVFLTIDKNLQTAMETQLSETISHISNTVAPDCKSGSAVCIDVNSGEILAIASHPSYIPSEYNKKYNELIKNPGNPVWNRAIGGAYEPGSTFKMLTAIAAIEEGVISPTEVVLDNGVYKYYKAFGKENSEYVVTS